MKSPALQTKPVQQIVIESTALYFGMSVDELLCGKSRTYNEVYKKHICFYLMRHNCPMLSREFIAKMFKCSGSTVQYGEDKIASEKEIYSQTLGNIRDIQDLIDNFKQKLRESWLTHNSSSIS